MTADNGRYVGAMSFPLSTEMRTLNFPASRAASRNWSSDTAAGGDLVFYDLAYLLVTNRPAPEGPVQAGFTWAGLLTSLYFASFSKKGVAYEIPHRAVEYPQCVYSPRWRLTSQLTAQAHPQTPSKYHQYKLYDVGTFGGPNSEGSFQAITLSTKDSLVLERPTSSTYEISTVEHFGGKRKASRIWCNDQRADRWRRRLIRRLIRTHSHCILRRTTQVRALRTGRWTHARHWDT